MEFEFSVNALLEDVITRLDRRVLPRGSHMNNDRSRDHRRQLLHAIDSMGEASAKAQGLYGAITGGRKLELSDHILYLMKDPGANNGRGAIVGLLKTGHKKLFVYDNWVQHEMMPLCILDFYVHESRQRQGCGRRLFEYMLKCENVRPNHFAIDKPSHKFSMFLAKHYNLRAVIPQVNNFVVFEGFFSNRTDVDQSRSRSGRPPVYRKPEEQRNAGMHSRAYTMDSKPPPGHVRGRPPSGKSSHRCPNPPPVNPHAAQENNQNPEMNDLNFNSRPNSGSKKAEMPRHRSPNPVHLDMRSLSAGSNSSRGLGAGINMYSRHNAAPPDNRLQRHSSLDRLNALESRVQDPGPPMLQRAGPPPGYAEMMNLHQDYQGRQGHLKVQSHSSSTLPQVHRPPHINSYHNPGGRTHVPVLYNPPLHGQPSPHHQPLTRTPPGLSTASSPITGASRHDTICTVACGDHGSMDKYESLIIKSPLCDTCRTPCLLRVELLDHRPSFSHLTNTFNQGPYNRGTALPNSLSPTISATAWHVTDTHRHPAANFPLPVHMRNRCADIRK